MNHDEIQLLAARCLTEPTFLTKALELARAGRLTATLEIPPQPFPDEAAVATVFGLEELERLELFRGFITKVKHSSVRKILPSTFRLLEYLDIELGFFVEFSTVYAQARAGGPLPTEAHLLLLEEHLLPYLKHLPDDDRVLVRDVFLHERALWQAAQAQNKTEGRDSEEGIAWRGCLLINRYSIDVAAACLTLRQLAFRRGSYATDSEHLLAYWRAWEVAGVSIFEIDELTALIFSEVDGDRTIPAIATSLAHKGLPEITAEELEGFFEEAAAKGLVRLPGKAMSAGCFEGPNGLS